MLRAQAPENPPEEWEPVEEGDDTIQLTDSAIKVSVGRAVLDQGRGCSCAGLRACSATAAETSSGALRCRPSR